MVLNSGGHGNGTIALAASIRVGGGVALRANKRTATRLNEIHRVS